jgi:predicted lactoylglutathione lyase
MTKIIINIDVPNLDAGVTFYTAGLGFELRRTLFQRTVAELTLGEDMAFLIEQKEGTKPFPAARQSRTFERHWTPVHIDVVVDDMTPAVKKAIEAGAVQSGETTTHSWGILTPLADPFGHGICLLQFSEAEYNSVAD